MPKGPLVLLAALLSLPALAQTASGPGPAPAAGGALPDPTRPPMGVDALTRPGGADGIASETPPVLSSVVIPAQGKPRAVIDGRSLTLGDQVGEARIVRITETGVVLKGAQGSQVLALTPGVEKKMLGTASGTRRAGVKKP